MDGNPQGALRAGDLNVEDWLRNKMLATGLWEKSRRMGLGVGRFLEYRHPVIGPTLTAYPGEGRERRPEQRLPPFPRKLFGRLSGKPAVSPHGQPRGRTSSLKPGVFIFPVLCDIDKDIGTSLHPGGGLGT